ncbi:MAG: cytidine deaminase [Clostridia bacterium]|jgi:cytidine deaminase
MKTDQCLVEEALRAKENAYAPYSKFRVGAALLSCDGQVFTGCNIENASFGATNCAERTAIFKAVSEGRREFAVIAIASDSSHFTYPCGICRQVMAEFNSEMRIIVANREGESKALSLNELLPHSFASRDMKK